MKLNLDQLSEVLGINRRYCRDNLAKRPDFPKPFVVSRFLRFWDLEEVQQWFEEQRRGAVGRPRG